MKKEIKEIERERKWKETGWKKREKVRKNAKFFKKPKRKRNECERIRTWGKRDRGEFNKRKIICIKRKKEWTEKISKILRIKYKMMYQVKKYKNWGQENRP